MIEWAQTESKASTRMGSSFDNAQGTNKDRILNLLKYIIHIFSRKWCRVECERRTKENYWREELCDALRGNECKCNHKENGEGLPRHRMTIRWSVGEENEPSDVPAEA